MKKEELAWVDALESPLPLNFSPLGNGYVASLYAVNPCYSYSMGALKTKKCLDLFQIFHQQAINYLKLTPDGKTVLSSSSVIKPSNRWPQYEQYTTTLQMNEVPTGKLLYAVTGIKDRVTAIAVHPDGLRVFISYDSGNIEERSFITFDLILRGLIEKHIRDLEDKFNEKRI